MSIDDCAVAAVATFGDANVARMVAIAGAESGYEPDARGDSLDSFSPRNQQLYSQYAWEGHLSFGYWQIFLGVHTQLVRNLSGLSRPDELANWLFDGRNNARAAAEIFNGQGFSAWSTYNNAAYLDFEIEASAAIARVRGAQPAHSWSGVTAVSFDGLKVHLDFIDGTFEERHVSDYKLIAPWVRIELASL